MGLSQPAFGRRITEDSLIAFRQALPPKSSPGSSSAGGTNPPPPTEDLTADQWLAVRSDAEPSGELSLAVDVGPNQVWSSIVACGGGVIEVIDRRRGASWLTRTHGRTSPHDTPSPSSDSTPPDPSAHSCQSSNEKHSPVRLSTAKTRPSLRRTLIAGITDKTLSHRGGTRTPRRHRRASRQPSATAEMVPERLHRRRHLPTRRRHLAHWLRLSREGPPTHQSRHRASSGGRVAQPLLPLAGAVLVALGVAWIFRHSDSSSPDSASARTRCSGTSR